MAQSVSTIISRSGGKDTQSEPFKMVSIKSLKRNPHNHRGFVSLDMVEDLVASIRLHGILQPLVVKPDMEIIIGERRYVAAMAAGFTKVPVIIREVEDEKERDELALVENVQRENLNPIAEAKVYAAMMKDDCLGVAQISKRVGVHSDRIRNLVSLLDAPGYIQEGVVDYRIGISAAKALIQIKDPQEQRNATMSVLNCEVSVKELKHRQPRPKPTKSAADLFIEDANRAIDRIEDARNYLLVYPEFKDVCREIQKAQYRIVDVLSEKTKKVK